MGLPSGGNESSAECVLRGREEDDYVMEPELALIVGD
jgi:hypothetical protein